MLNPVQDPIQPRQRVVFHAEVRTKAKRDQSAVSHIANVLLHFLLGQSLDATLGKRKINEVVFKFDHLTSNIVDVLLEPIVHHFRVLTDKLTEELNHGLDV